MCHPIQIIVETTELLQEFFKDASLCGFVESWCLELRLLANESIPVECSSTQIQSLLRSLHSLYFYIQKALKSHEHRELSDAESCSCGWSLSELPNFHHSEVRRYTSGTVIRWSQGECHILLSPQVSSELNEEIESNSGDLKKNILPFKHPDVFHPMEQFDKDQGPLEVTETDGVIENESLVNETEATACSQSETGEDSKQMQSTDDHCNSPDNPDCESENESTPLNTDSLTLTSSPPNCPIEQPLEEIEDSDEECSRMLVINEEVNSLQEFPEETESKGNEEENCTALTFKRVLPITAENLRVHCLNNPSPASSEANVASERRTENESDKNEDDDDDSSSISSSSSSSCTSSSSSSSDDDDRINFKQRIEEAAQAAREAAANATPKSSELETFFSPSFQYSQAALGSKEILGVQNMEPNVFDGQVSSFSLAANRNPDDLQAAQGLAALGKTQASETAFASPSGPKLSQDELGQKKKTNTRLEKLLQIKEVNICQIGSNMFQCGVCGNLFNRMEKAAEHQFKHTGEKPWSCESCDKRFAKYYSLQMHIRIKHTPVHLQAFNCGICSKNFGSRSHLKHHMTFHANPKPFVCEVCGKAFAQKATKTAHESQHTGNRPWSCNVCGKSFVTKYKLKFHAKVHDQKLCCLLCKTVFSSQDTLRRHMKRHQAGVEFKRNKKAESAPMQPQTSKNEFCGNFAKPVNSSYGCVPPVAAEPNYRCQMCGKEFVKSVELTHHLSSCNALVYSPSSNQVENVPSVLTSSGSEKYVAQTSVHPSAYQFQHDLSASSSKCLGLADKHIEVFSGCDMSNVVVNDGSIVKKQYSMCTVVPENETIGQVLPNQQLNQTSNGVPELPDILSEVNFNSGNESIAFST